MLSRLFCSKAVPVKLLGPTAKAFVQDSSRREKSRDSSDLDLLDSWDAIDDAINDAIDDAINCSKLVQCHGLTLVTI